ncbi:CPBP family intramembrane glutamic endopeptidase [Nocardiopsis sp. B62]|uniref:CPBP family intramembrane glutamic endopeptidase n=1 Tax=Nocardiopsis sp. B62 TaxID=2824874 RepID=UPI001B374598|nr:CPBP family intramembrane glutamic endopeptidase [Nocardiopsis sp. B62]MBQ1081397.1 CPBP family intramembrane metalloprotease [Nocardiopsis sp. B62]
MSFNDTLAQPEAGEQHVRARGHVPPGVEYHRVLAGGKRRVGRGLLAIALLILGMFVLSFAAAQAAGFADLRMGRVNPAMGGTDYTPLYHGATMFSLTLLIPWSMVLQRWLYGVRGASLHSVASRFRFDVLGRALVFIGPVWLLSLLVLNLSPAGERTHWSAASLVVLIVITLLLTPLQSAGEEYGLRGLVFRIAGSWGRGPRVSLFLGVLVSSALFTVLHGADDPWINLWYFTLAASLAVITWRTGGIEIAVVIHALLNTVTFVIAAALHTDIGSAVTDRSAGAGSPVLLVPTLTVAVIAAVVWWRSHRTGPALTPASPHPEQR